MATVRVIEPESGDLLVLATTGAVCGHCEGAGVREVYVHELRRLAMRKCRKCRGTGKELAVAPPVERIPRAVAS